MCQEEPLLRYSRIWRKVLPLYVLYSVHSRQQHRLKTH
jgi:hypothetical protein